MEKRRGNDTIKPQIVCGSMAPSTFLVVLLASFAMSSHSFHFPSLTSGSGVGRMNNLSTKQRIYLNQDCCAVASISTWSGTNMHSNHQSQHRKRSMCICHMNTKNKSQNFFGGNRENDDEENKEEEQSTTKRGAFKRIRDRIFGGGNKKDQDNNQVDGKIGYKPSPIDAMRLNLARAMSGFSNMNLFGKKEEWAVACPKTRVGPGQIIPCSVNGLDIIIFASRDGKRLDAFANACPHLGSPFDLATIERKPVQQERGKLRADDGTGDGCVDCIICPVHRTAFEIQSGKVQGEWCPYPPVIGNVMGYVKPKQDLVKFAVRLRGKNVEVRVATSVKNVAEGQEEALGLKEIK